MSKLVAPCRNGWSRVCHVHNDVLVDNSVHGLCVGRSLDGRLSGWSSVCCRVLQSIELPSGLSDTALCTVVTVSTLCYSIC